MNLQVLQKIQLTFVLKYLVNTKKYRKLLIFYIGLPTTAGLLAKVSCFSPVILPTERTAKSYGSCKGEEKRTDALNCPCLQITFTDSGD